MKHDEYEILVRGIVNILFERVRDVSPEHIGHGLRNKIRGISGYRHQIDVSLHASGELILVECKKWERKISVSEFLTFLGRLHDMAAAFHGQTEGIMVTTKGFQSGVLTLAKHYRRVELIQAT